MRNLWSRKEGNFAVMVALMIVPIFGAAGLAVDYSRVTTVYQTVQNAVDAAALASLHAGPDGDLSPRIDYLKSAIVSRSVSRIDDLQVDAGWLSPTDLRVTVTGEVPLTILAAVPGFPNKVPISVTATARLSEPNLVYEPPTFTSLDPEAADYNRIYVYCFHPDEQGSERRTDMTLIADNTDKKFSYTMPSCKDGQPLSYRLLNARNVHDDPTKWDDPKTAHYNYFTDTVLDNNGAEKYDLKEDMLETILCDTAEECDPDSKDSILPTGSGRTPEHNQRACAPGKLLYFGWEDRPPSGSSDRDYNDIRLVMSCPTIEAVGDRSVRLLR